VICIGARRGGKKRGETEELRRRRRKKSISRSTVETLILSQNPNMLPKP
jgi:hypothetical protein